MKNLNVKLLVPNKDNFKSFGELISIPDSVKPATLSDNHDYWHNLTDFSSLKNEAATGFLRVYRKNRTMVFNQMERHSKTIEAFIPINGTGIFFMCPADERPDPSKMAAFILDRTFGVSLKPGTWHWLPYPLTEHMDFVLILRKSTVEEDLEIVNLDDEYNINLIRG